MLDGVVKSVYQEVELYFLLKSVIDPITLIAQKNKMVPRADIDFFVDSFLTLFPRVGKNIYLKGLAEKSQQMMLFYNLLNKAI